MLVTPAPHNGGILRVLSGYDRDDCRAAHGQQATAEARLAMEIQRAKDAIFEQIDAEKISTASERPQERKTQEKKISEKTEADQRGLGKPFYSNKRSLRSEDEEIAF